MYDRLNYLNGFLHAYSQTHHFDESLGQRVIYCHLSMESVQTAKCEFLIIFIFTFLHHYIVSVELKHRKTYILRMTEPP